MINANRLGLASKSKLDSGQLEICHKALRLAKGAFAPISGFAVGVIIRTPDGREFTGQNQENSALDSIHAEMAALANWNAAGEPKIEAIAIAGFKFWPTQEKSAVITPCGRCRQWLYEAIIRSESNPEIICANGDLSDIRSYRIDELLPHAFSMHDSAAIYEDWYSRMRQSLLDS
jgi:cytidine deaminase